MAFSRFTGIITNVAASNTDAWFRTHVGLSDALTAAGMPKTSDTGQVDWTTVTLPAVTVYTAYEIRRFNDAEQATEPIFFKIAYGFTNVSTTSHPTVRITVGRGSDGAGNLTGASSAVINVALNPTTTVRPWLLSSDGGGFACIAGVTPSIARVFFSLERARDIDGVPIPGVVLYTTAVSTAVATPSFSNSIAGIIDFANSVTYASNTVPVAYWKSIALYTDSLAYGDVYPFGIITIPTAGSSSPARSKLWVGAARSDFPDGAVVNVPRFSGGGTFKYLMEVKEGQTLGGGFGPSPSGAGSQVDDTSSGFAMPLIYWQ